MRAALLLAGLLLASCAGIELKDPEDPLAAIPDRSGGLEPGRSDRAVAHRLLGEPLVAGERIGFELYRADTTQSMVEIMLTPLPVPFGRWEDELLRYTLVAYDGGSKVAGSASGIFRKPSEFRRTYPIDGSNQALHLRVGGLMFFVDPEGARRENLLLAPDARDAYLRSSLDPRACTLLLGCGGQGCPDTVAIDGGPERRLPLRAVQLYWLPAERRADWLAGVSAPSGQPLAWLETLVALELAPGEHTLKFSARRFDGSHASHLSCGAGRISYLVVHARDNERTFGRALVDWRVERSEVLPPPFAARPLVVLHQGEWFVGDAHAD